MADWQTVRFDPTYEEKLDDEIIPLCDALNSAGFITIGSCCGHGRRFSYVYFKHSTDERIERLARFVKATEIGDYRRYFSVWQKEILLLNAPDCVLAGGSGYDWCVEIHCNNVYDDTPINICLVEMNHALAGVTEAVRRFEK